MQTGTYSLWLLPSRRDGRNLSPIIERLADTYQSFSFLPHVTIYRVKPISRSEFSQSLIPVLSSARSIPVSLATPKTGNKVNKTVFAPIEHSEALFDFYSSVKRVFSAYPAFPYDPHISLLYKRGISEDDKKTALENSSVPPTITLSRCVFVHSVVSLTEGSDCPQWDVVHEQLLY